MHNSQIRKLGSAILPPPLTIPTGGMYQEWCCLSDVVEEATARKLEALASEKGWRIIDRNEAVKSGFEELANWSVPETDILVFIDENYLVCLSKKDFQTSEC